MRNWTSGLAVLAAASALSAPASAGVKGDINGDGFADLAAGAPQEAIDAIGNAGSASVIYGSSTGLAAAGNQLFWQGQPSIVGTAEAGDGYGWALASGDFNNDGRADLAVGAPGEAVGTVRGAGAVSVLYGSASGLTASGNQILSQGSAGLAETAEQADAFGDAIATGDFDGDGFGDLAIGVPGEDIGSGSTFLKNVGAAQIVYGSPTGLVPSDGQVLVQGQGGVEGTTESFDRFGGSLAAGNFGKSAAADLAVGVPDEAVGSRVSAGSVNVLYGGTAGLSTTGDQIFSQGVGGLVGTSEAGDRFGAALAAGDFGNGTSADLAIGTPEESIGARDDAGSVAVIYGSATGLTTTGNQGWVQGQAGLPGTAETGDFFGASLAAADIGAGNAQDLVVGAPDEDVGAVEDAGAVSTIFGSTSGLVATNAQILSQGDSFGVNDRAERGDGFGWALAAGQFGRSAKADVAIGAPYENYGSANAGIVNVLYGTASGLTGSGDQIFAQGTGGLAGTREARDLFGFGLAP